MQSLERETKRKLRKTDIKIYVLERTTDNLKERQTKRLERYFERPKGKDGY